MQTFLIDVPPVALRRRAPNWIWITLAVALAVPLSVFLWSLSGALEPDTVLSIAVAAFFGVGVLAKEGWYRFFPTRVSVGDDGLHIAWRWGSAFIPGASIKTVAEVDGEVVVTLASGEQWAFGCLSDEPGSARGPLNRAIAASLASRDSSRAASDLAPRLARRGRPLTEWLATVRAATSKSSAYRGAGIPRDDLFRIVQDPSAAPSARVAATVALGALGDAERARVRVAADASASPVLREVLPLIAASAGDAARVSTAGPDSASEDPEREGIQSQSEQDALYRAIERALAHQDCE